MRHDLNAYDVRLPKTSWKTVPQPWTGPQLRYRWSQCVGANKMQVTPWQIEGVNV